MTEQQKRPAIFRCKTALARKRRNLLIALISVAVLAILLAIVLYVTSLITFYDPVDNAKYSIERVKKTAEEIAAEKGDDEEKEVEKQKYVMKNAAGEILPTTEEGNYITAAGTLVYVNAKTGEYSTVAAVLSEDGDTVQFNVSSSSYDVLLYPLLQRANIAEITVHNEKGSFTISKIIGKDEDGKQVEQFVLAERVDLVVSDTPLFATLVYCTGNTRTMLRLDTAKVKEYGYAEYGLENPKVWFEITEDTAEGAPIKKHKVYVGDPVPSGDGYYVRYDGREAVYVLYELAATEYNGTSQEALNARAEDFVIAPSGSYNMEQGNYFDVTDFKIFEGQNKKPKIDFSYTGSIEKRNDTYYSNIPYASKGDTAGYVINSYRVDDCLYQLYTWNPDAVVSLGTADQSDVNAWLAEYGLDVNSYAYRMEYVFNVARKYDAKNDDDTPLKADQEKHIILISKKQTEGDYKGYYLVYTLCYAWNAKDRDFTSVVQGYNMILAMDESQLNFLFWSENDWVSKEIFSGQIAYMEEMIIKVGKGDYAGVYENGYEARFSIDNEESLKELMGSGQSGSNAQISSDKMVVRDMTRNGLVIDTMQFKRFYSFLLYTSASDVSTLSEQDKQDYIDSGDDGAWLSIYIRYELRTRNPETGYYDKTGEVVERVYRFYRSLGDPTRQAYTTIAPNKTDKGVGEFYTLTTRINEIIKNVEKLYHPETPISIK